MSKVIKIDDETYKELDSLRAEKQTFNDVVRGLLKGRETTLRAMDMLEGDVHFLEWQNRKLR